METLSAAPKPFVGPFPIEYGQPFFGRETETADLASRLVARRIVLLHAPSGAGKTSLIQAGLIPALEGQSFLTLRTIRVNRTPPPGALSEGCCNRFILSTLISLEEGLPEESQTPLAELADAVLADYLATHREIYAQHSANPSARRTLLIFDQFEEILTTEPTRRAIKEEFFSELMTLLHDNRYWFLFAMREEYLARLEPYLSYFPDRLSAHFGLDFLSPAAALEAIQKPTQQFNVVFQDEAADKLVQDLRQIRQQDENGQVILTPGPTIEPVQLQVVCSYLWDAPRPNPGQITLADVLKWADVDNALALYYAGQVRDIAQQTNVSERMLRKWFEERLITASGLRIQVLAGLENEYQLTPDCMRKLNDAFLVRAETRRGATWYELAHDRLVQPVLDNNKAWFVENLSLLQLRTERWLKSGRQSELLLAGRDLREATTWAKAHAKDLTDLEREFLSESDIAFRQQGRAIRNRRIMLSLGIVLVVISVLTVLAFLGARRNQIQADQTSRSLATLYGEISKGLRQAPEIENKLVTAIRAMEVTEWRDQGDTNAARQAIYDALGSSGGTRYQAATRDSSPNPLTTLALSADGRWLATAGSLPPPSLWDLSAGADNPQPLELTGQVSALTTLAMHPQGRYLAGGSPNGNLLLWDLSRPGATPRILQSNGGRINSLSFSPDGRWLAVGSAVPAQNMNEKGNLLQLWDLSCQSPGRPLRPDLGSLYPTPTEDEQATANLSDIEDAVIALAFNPERDQTQWLVVAGEHDPSAADPTTLLLAALRLDDLPPCSAALPDIQSARLSSPPEASDTAQPDENLPTQEEQESAFTSLAISPQLSDGRYYLISGGDNGNVRAWRLDPTEALEGGVIIGKHQEGVNDQAFDPHARWLASASSDDQILYWNIEDLQLALDPGQAYAAEPRSLQGHQDDIKSILFSPDGNWLFSASSDYTLRGWDFSLGDPSANPLLLYGHQGAVTALDSSIDHPRLVSASEDGTLRLWDLDGGGLPAQPYLVNLPEAFNSQIVANPDWAFFFDLVKRQGSLIDLANFQPGQTQSLKPVDMNLPADIQLDLFSASQYGNWLAAAGSLPAELDARPFLQLWRVDENIPALESVGLIEVDQSIARMDFDPADDWLVTRDYDDQATLWSLSDSEFQALPLDSGDKPVTAVAFSSDGRWLAMGGVGGQLLVWDLNQRGTPNRLARNQKASPDAIIEISENEPICGLAFHPQSNLLVIAGAQEAVYTWRARPQSTEVDTLDVFEAALGNVVAENPQDALHQGQAEEQEPPATSDPQESCLGRPSRMAFSPDGRWLALAIETQDPDLIGEAGAVSQILLADLGMLENNPLESARLCLQDFWSDLQLGDIPDEAWILPNNPSKITAMTFSPQGDWLAIGDENNSESAVRLWRTSDPLAEPVRLDDPIQAIRSLNFSEDQRWLAAGSQDGFLRIWAIEPLDLIQLACRTLGRQPSSQELKAFLPAEDWVENWQDFCDD